MKRKDTVPGLRAALFDLDGTLLDTLHDLADAMNAALSLHGLRPVDPQAYRLLVGTGASELSRLASCSSLEASGVDATEADVRSREIAPLVLQDFRDAYEAGFAHRTTPYAGIPEALATLRQEGIPIAVLSNKPDPFTKRLVAHFFPDIPFDKVCGERVSEPRKPDPAAAREILASIGVPVSRIVYFGDSGLDMRFAKAAGFRAAGVLWGFRTRDELIEGGADVLLDDPKEIFENVEFPHKGASTP